MQIQERAVLREIVLSACRHVLPKCGVPIEPEPEELSALAPAVEQLAGFIGFTSAPLRGALTLMAPTVAVRDSFPLPCAEGSEGSLELFDWWGEVVNRLLGRVRHELAKRAVDIEASIPKAMMGEHLRFPIAARRAVCTLQFTSKGNKVIVLVDAQASSADTFGEKTSATGIPLEGELLLF
ncbi:MAG TPA: hypothetical protein VGL13_06295 [Polyangiaceae bacterium]|jgi:hypothetical protein